MKTLQKLGLRETIVLTTIACVALIYAFYFLILPQNWGLMDDYNYARLWGGDDFKPWASFVQFMNDLMTQGRFRPVDGLYRIFRYGFAPVTPRAFHAWQFGFLIIAIVAFVDFLRRFKLSNLEILFATLLVVANLSVKEWLIYTTAAESFATMFLMVALAFYAHRKKWYAILFFALSIHSKESFFIFSLIFLSLEFVEFKKKKKGFDFLPSIAFCALTAGFVIFVKTLPQESYSGGLTLQKLSILGIGKAIVLPVVRSMGPALLLVAIAVYFRKKLALKGERKTLFLVGLGISFLYTIFLCAWGPFDSWFYLHLPIPFGWAMMLAALWQPGKFKTSEWAAFGLVIMFSILATVNGSRNLYLYLENATKVADLACEESMRTRGLKVYNNCSEGSGQLQEYLMVSPNCKRAPEIRYLRGAGSLPKSVRRPYMLIISSRCDGFHFNRKKYSHSFDLKYWTVLKKL